MLFLEFACLDIVQLRHEIRGLLTILRTLLNTPDDKDANEAQQEEGDHRDWLFHLRDDGRQAGENTSDEVAKSKGCGSEEYREHVSMRDVQNVES